MNARRYFLLSQTHRQQLSQTLASALKIWHDMWWPDSVEQLSPDPGIAASPEWAPTQSEHRFAMRVENRKVGWIRLLNGQSSALLDRAAGGSGVSGGALAERLGYRLIADLMARILGVDPERMTIDAESCLADATIFGPGGDGIGVVLRGSDIAIELLLLADAVKTFAAGPLPRALPRNAFAPAEQVVVGQLCPLRVTLDLPGGVVLDEIRELTEGHILLLDVPPSAAWTVVGANDVRLGLGRPGHVGDRLAVQLFTNEKR